MKKVSSIVISLFSILLIGNISANAQRIPYMSLIDNKEMKYMDNAEISIDAWREYQYLMKKTYGQDSKEFLSTIFDSIVFDKYYGNLLKYSPNELWISPPMGSKKDLIDCSDYPMIGISYKQCIDYCKWRTEIYNYKIKGVSKITFSIPSHEDYAKAISKAKITNNPPLFKLVNKKRGKITGVTDNVKEYNIGNKINPNDNPIGFRCIAIIEKD
ncbi:MAG: hypothetical protein WCR29_07815 [Bacteroidales bacterium]|nr:hypothetical protein [Bacteroidales bacterium]